jgi:uncharacterized protein
MHPELHAGARLFNAGEYWEAHEVWEVPWQAAKARGDQSWADYIQGLILLAAAIHKRRHYDNLRGGEGNYQKALRRLSHLPAQHDGLDLAALRAEVALALHQADLRPQLPLLALGQPSSSP